MKCYTLKFSVNRDVFRTRCGSSQWAHRAPTLLFFQVAQPLWAAIGDSVPYPTFQYFVMCGFVKTLQRTLNMAVCKSSAAQERSIHMAFATKWCFHLDPCFTNIYVKSLSCSESLRLSNWIYKIIIIIFSVLQLCVWL